MNLRSEIKEFKEQRRISNVCPSNTGRISLPKSRVFCHLKWDTSQFSDSEFGSLPSRLTGTTSGDLGTFEQDPGSRIRHCLCGTCQDWGSRSPASDPTSPQSIFARRNSAMFPLLFSRTGYCLLPLWYAKKIQKSNGLKLLYFLCYFELN